MSRARDLADYVSTGVTSAELDKLDGLTATTDELNLVDGSVSGPLSHRNRIINGNFDIWQRGTSQTSAGYGSADRWNNDHSGSSKTASQQTFTLGQTEVPGNPKYYLRHVVTSVSGAGNYCLTQQKIEGVKTLAGKTVTLSFWAKADSSKNIATGFAQDFGTGGSPSSRVEGIGVTTHNLTTSWQKFTTTVSIPHLTDTGLAGGTPLTLGTDNKDFLHLLIWFESGSTYSSQNNSLGQQSGTFDIAQVQLEEGSVATPFEHRSFGDELAMCQRYYEKNYPISTDPGSTVGSGSAQSWTVSNIIYGRAVVDFKVRKRRTPDINLWATNGTSNQCEYWNNGSTGFISLGGPSASEVGFGTEVQQSTTWTSRAYIYFFWSANAEL